MVRLFNLSVTLYFICMGFGQNSVGLMGFSLLYHTHNLRVFFCVFSRVTIPYRCSIRCFVLDISHHRYVGIIYWIVWTRNIWSYVSVNVYACKCRNTFVNKKTFSWSHSACVRVRKRFLKLYVSSVTLCRGETWIPNETGQRVLESFEIWCWRRILRVGWTEHRTDGSILSAVNERREGYSRPWEQVDGTWLGHEKEN